MSAIHCFGVGLVGSYVAKKLALSGHEVHAYDPRPHRVMGFPGIEAHHMEPDEEPIYVMMEKFANDDKVEFDCDRDIVVNMLPGDIGHASTTILAEHPWRTIDLSFSKFTPDRDDGKAREKDR